jgi:hypothetical protein
MGLKEIRWGGVAWIHLVEGRDQWTVLVNMVMKFLVPQSV